MLLLVCGLKQQEIPDELTIGYHRVKNICEELRQLFGDGQGRQNMKAVVRNVYRAELVPRLIESLRHDDAIMAIVEERMRPLPEVELL